MDGAVFQDREAIVNGLKQHHRRQSQLCDTLEHIADSLPLSIDSQQCLHVARQVFPIVRQAHVFEEEKLFPYLQAMPDQNAGLAESLERLRFEHWEDESFAEELSDRLREAATGEKPEKSETLAYMLRGFFEGLRRHMAFESEHLLSLLERPA